LIAVNAGEEPRPLSRVASGGELSRVMLALQNVLADGDEAQTMIFDEIDDGISGSAAGRVAAALKSLSGRRQVLCVTHQAQIAAAARLHLEIRKEEYLGRAYTSVRPLDDEARAREIARILAGERVTAAVLRTAQEMMSDNR